MEINKTYSPAEIEQKWYQYWLDKKFFRSVPDQREPYTIVIPPPNVTGVLHMGHMLNNTIQDVLIRRARMRGFNACWVPGTDHASIATEAKVVKLLADQGIKKSDLSREEFLKHAWEWKEKYGGIILEQLKKLGASCDWDRTRFTMEEDLSEAVIDVFIDLHKKGQIYRGARMVNWDPKGLTAVSDEEVIYKEVNSKLYFVNYKIEGSQDEWITVATTRPETILGDTAVCVHPEDSRYIHLKGKKVIVPIVNRAVPIIFDDYVDREFGTGALKVTPAHDINDYNLGIKHKLPSIDVFNQDGTISEIAGHYVGQDRFAVRKKIAKDLEELGLLFKTEDIKNKVGYSERTDAVIEPRLSTQWFLKMSEISKPALENVVNQNIKLIPEKFINTYKHWMENVHDWCISRQLWWGQRIPAWYNSEGDFVVCKTKDEAISRFEKEGKKSAEIFQDEDVLDTWFSSWLWPISVFDGFKSPSNSDISYYYPTNDLVTAPEILFFWVARMIIAGYEYRGEKPFSNVYLTGIVRDKLGRKMSKSLGNSPDPLDLIAKYGADGVRVGMLLSSPAGNDLLFDESYCEQGRNFANKIWNAFRLIKGFDSSNESQPEQNKTAVKWFRNRFSEQLQIINEHYSKYRMSDALMTSYKLIWDDFCSWYLEMIKPEFVDGKPKPVDQQTISETIGFMEDLLKVIHPWMPFLSEELWHSLKNRSENDCIIVSDWPSEKDWDKDFLKQAEECKELIGAIRNVRQQKQISPKETLQLCVTQENKKGISDFQMLIKKLSVLSQIDEVETKPEGSTSIRVGTKEYYIPLGGLIDEESEKQRLIKELEYQQGFLKSVMQKLSNEKFVNNAKPEVIELERRKKADAETKINLIQEQIKTLS